MVLGIFNNLAPYHLLAYSLIYGTNVFHSYINAPILFKNLKREDFSKVTNLVLPKYFLVEAFAPIALYLTSPVLFDPRLKTFSAALLGVTSVTHLLNYFWILPKVQNLKVIRSNLEKELASEIKSNGEESELVKKLRSDLKGFTAQFGKYHGISLLLNMASTITLTGYGFVLSNGMLKFIPK